MKKLALLLIGLITLSSTTLATTNETTETTTRYNAVYDGSKYIFVENGIEFSVFPDGEFDFYIPEYVQGVNVGVQAGPIGISFNTGYDYDPYIQYDDYGAVIQIENTPLYYDNYGRLIQAGDVRINYRRNRIVNVGGMFIHYNNFGVFSHYTGFINVYNRHYVYRPFHNFFYRPVFNRCLVWTTPYRNYYTPVRYNYAFHRNNYYRGYRNGYRNARRDFRRPQTGRVAHNNGRRDNVDRNNASFRRVKNTNNRGRIASNTRRGDVKRSEKVSRGDRKDPRTSRGHISNSNRNGTSTGKNDRKRKSYGTSSRGTVTKGKPQTSRPKPSANKGRPSSRPTASKPKTSRRSSVSSKSSRSSNRATQSRSTTRKSSVSKPRSTKRNSPSRATNRSSSSRTNKATRSGSSRSSKSSNRTSRSRRG